MQSSWRTEVFSWGVIVAMFAAAAWAWGRVPDRIAIHWNAAGEANGYGGRFMGLLFPPLLTLGMQLLFLVLPAIDPRRSSYEEFANVYAILRTAVVAFMGAIYAATTLVALGQRIDMARVSTLLLGVLFSVLGSVLGKVRPNWFVGIRTPWTLSSTRSWDKTHRLGGAALSGLRHRHARLRAGAAGIGRVRDAGHDPAEHAGPRGVFLPRVA
jgi:uncharacterized membrane protein